VLHFEFNFTGGALRQFHELRFRGVFLAMISLLVFPARCFVGGDESKVGPRDGTCSTTKQGARHAPSYFEAEMRAV
jgi:hypothetical protein